MAVIQELELVVKLRLRGEFVGRLLEFDFGVLMVKGLVVFGRVAQLWPAQELVFQGVLFLQAVLLVLVYLFQQELWLLLGGSCPGVLSLVGIGHLQFAGVSKRSSETGRMVNPYSLLVNDHKLCFNLFCFSDCILAFLIV